MNFHPHYFYLVRALLRYNSHNIKFLHYFFAGTQALWCDDSWLPLAKVMWCLICKLRLFWTWNLSSVSRSYLLLPYSSSSLLFYWLHPGTYFTFLYTLLTFLPGFSTFSMVLPGPSPSLPLLSFSILFLVRFHPLPGSKCHLYKRVSSPSPNIAYT